MYRRAGRQADRLPRPLLVVFAAMTFAGWMPTVPGWYVTEIGRQPYIVFGPIRTAEVAADVPASMISTTLALYVALYLALCAVRSAPSALLGPAQPFPLLATSSFSSCAGSRAPGFWLPSSNTRPGVPVMRCLRPSA